ncbi:uncharacterized protein LOC119676247 [Teleopsis dalmanni]|uniref:uncharacterized protein LOC119676247 n=1 Tax=Teleopsis dalmanni TaxID=139649 RepID=UPI0018CD3C3B|nr:uncharacterized protein LOC119676247 [Teleopsis dalmanni]
MCHNAQQTMNYNENECEYNKNHKSNDIEYNLVKSTFESAKKTRTLPNWSIGTNSNKLNKCRVNTYNRGSRNKRDQFSKTNKSATKSHFSPAHKMSEMRKWLTILAIFMSTTNAFAVAFAKTDEMHISTIPSKPSNIKADEQISTTTIKYLHEKLPITNATADIDTDSLKLMLQNSTTNYFKSKPLKPLKPVHTDGTGGDSIFMNIAKRFSTGNELWDGIIRDCYHKPTFSCFQKNVYGFLNEALDVQDLNVTQRLKFFKNSVDYVEQSAEHSAEQQAPTEAAAAKDAVNPDEINDANEHLNYNEIPQTGRAAAETPIEEVTNALYGKSIKFALTHNMELKLPETLFDGATFRISPRSFEGNGMIAKLEFIPKQEVEARLAGKILMKKIQKFFKSKLMLSFLALLLIVKIIKIKIFWLLPLVIGVSAAKKLLLKFLLFLFPALSHLFKLCSYYQQTYHTTKYHHHHHLINHHHTVVPSWHNAETSPIPEIIYSHPPKGHISTYLHGAPIHETYGVPHSHEHFENWESSGPGLGSEYISDINRVAQVDSDGNYFKPQEKDANELYNWGLGTTQQTQQFQQQIQQQQQLAQQQQQQQLQRKPRPPPATQQQRPPALQKQQKYQSQVQNYQPVHATSHSTNPFISPEQQSIFGPKLKTPLAAQSAPRPVYTPPPRNGGPLPPPPPNAVGSNGAIAAQIAAKYNPVRNNPHQQQQPQLSPELTAQVKEALRIQAEQRIIAQQQKILENQPFVQDGQPLMPKNYDPFYSPILLKIDKIVEQLGVTDDLCKERLVCSMYKDPDRYSPHSNFVSAELSRDSNELEPVTKTNEAVIRFYRLIQAARDGQDQRDCLRLYPQCNINTK